MGINFLEVEPKHFSCEHTNPDTGEITWTPCKKREICENSYTHDQYHADTNDSEYIDNWVEKFELLCEPKYKIGLIGSMYFIGVITTLTFVPLLADMCGRKGPFIITLIVSACA